MSDSMQRMVSLAGLWVLAAVAIAGLLYGMYVMLGGSQARIRSRVRQFVISHDQVPIDEADARAKQRASFFAELDSRWDDRSLFKALNEDLQSADLHFTPSELLIIEVLAGLVAGFLVWYFVPLIGLLLVPAGIALGMYG